MSKKKLRLLVFKAFYQDTGEIGSSGQGMIWKEIVPYILEGKELMSVLKEMLVPAHKYETQEALDYITSDVVAHLNSNPLPAWRSKIAELAFKENLTCLSKYTVEEIRISGLSAAAALIVAYKAMKKS